MSSSTILTPVEKSGRVEWLDVFRGAAVVAMIETHVVNTFMAPVLREAAWFGWLNWFNGLVAPAFLFIAGFAQGMSWRANPGKRVDFGRKVKRLLGVAVIGYALHFPFTEIGQQRWGEALRVGSQVDVLQCLAVTLASVLAVQVLCGWLAEKWRWPAGLAAWSGLAVATIWLAPASAGWNAGPLPLAAFLNDHTGSLFPLFPWAAFVFCGAVVGLVAVGNPAWLLLAAGVVRGGALLLDGGTFSALSPVFFCARLAWVLALAALCQWMVRVWSPRGLRFAGRESLVMYAAHLVIIQWTVQAGVSRGAFDPGGAAIIFSAVLAATCAVALAKAKWSERTTKAAVAPTV